MRQRVFRIICPSTLGVRLQNGCIFLNVHFNSDDKSELNGVKCAIDETVLKDR